MGRLGDTELIEELRERIRGKEAALLALRATTGKLGELNRRLLESERLKTRFLASIRNEIYNPLASIQAIAGELEAGAIADPADVRAFGATIAGESAALAFQLRNIFAAAELEAGEAVPCLAGVDARRVVAGAAAAFRSAAAGRRVSIETVWEGGGEDGGTFRTDAAKLQIIAANLVANAVQFSAEGEAVTVRGGCGGGELVLTVRDRGPGLAPAEQARLFERFRQRDEGHCRSCGGPGLGLSVVRALVELLGGTLGIESAPGAGSAFTVRLPEAREETGAVFASAGNEVFYGEEWL